MADIEDLTVAELARRLDAASRAELHRRVLALEEIERCARRVQRRAKLTRMVAFILGTVVGWYVG